MRYVPFVVLFLGVLTAIGLSSVFILDEREQALVLAFGKVERVEREPGLKFKLPAPLNTVVRYDDRILPIETENLEVTPLDNRRLVVVAFARWRIEDPQKFREAVQTQRNGEERLKEILNARVRQVLGGVNSSDILSDRRIELVGVIKSETQDQAEDLGVRIVDVRIRSADLPEQNLAATFERMKSERKQEAEDQRARGREAKRRLVAAAERTATEELATARKEAEIIKGKADATRNRIFAEAFEQDEEFFAFYRSLRAYERALDGSNSTMVISPDSEFFEYLKSDTIAPASQ